VNWMAELALLAVLPLKCFVFLSTVKHYIFFSSEGLAYCLIVIMGNYWLIRL
jgi:hypothetical protein